MTPQEARRSAQELAAELIEAHLTVGGVLRGPDNRELDPDSREAQQVTRALHRLIDELTRRSFR